MNNSIGESWHTTASVKNELLTPLCVVEMFELVLYSFKISAGCLLAAEAVAAAAECMCACGHQQRQCMQRRTSATHCAASCRRSAAAARRNGSASQSGIWRQEKVEESPQARYFTH